LSQSAAISELARQVRQFTLDVLARCEPAWLTWAPPGTSNHILWHAGHALWVADVLCLEPLTGRSELPPGWEDTYGMDCRPVASTKTWPTREEFVKLLSAQLERLRVVLAAASDDTLSQIIDDHGNTLASRIIHGLHDEAKHQGEMYLLFKMCRANAAAT
jgi:hypothetical protein